MLVKKQFLLRSPTIRKVLTIKDNTLDKVSQSTIFAQFHWQLNKITMEKGTKENPWQLKTPPLSSDYEMYMDVNKEGKDIIVCKVGSTTLHYDAKAIEDLHAMLKEHGDWMELGSADEQKPAKEGTVEAWGRAENNPVGGW